MERRRPEDNEGIEKRERKTNDGDSPWWMRGKRTARGYVTSSSLATARIYNSSGLPRSSRTVNGIKREQVQRLNKPWLPVGVLRPRIPFCQRCVVTIGITVGKYTYRVVELRGCCFLHLFFVIRFFSPSCTTKTLTVLRFISRESWNFGT